MYFCFGENGTPVNLNEGPFAETVPVRRRSASATGSVHGAIKVPACQQKPNRHENSTVSTKDQRQTKPLVVSESERTAAAPAGPAALGSALFSIYRLPPSPRPLSCQEERCTFGLLSHRLEQLLRQPAFIIFVCCVNLVGSSEAPTWALAGSLPN